MGACGDPAGSLVILEALTRRFDIGPFVLALGALAASGRPVPRLVRRVCNAWDVFEITDLFLAALAVAALVAAVGLAHA